MNAARHPTPGAPRLPGAGLSGADPADGRGLPHPLCVPADPGLRLPVAGIVRGALVFLRRGPAPAEPLLPKGGLNGRSALVIDTIV